ncbi:hypothetical protein BDZ91DRAFT_787883 [Kalaharituber pfeilii]|nr:hypothetical protein BDZ91DRAFT_787883 [Kalaharituber pfeilii]
MSSTTDGPIAASDYTSPASMPDAVDAELLYSLNAILASLSLPRISNILDATPNLLIALYEALYEKRIPFIDRSPKSHSSFKSRVKNIKILIGTIAHEADVGTQTAARLGEIDPLKLCEKDQDAVRELLWVLVGVGKLQLQKKGLRTIPVAPAPPRFAGPLGSGSFVKETRLLSTSTGKESVFSDLQKSLQKRRELVGIQTILPRSTDGNVKAYNWVQGLPSTFSETEDSEGSFEDSSAASSTTEYGGSASKSSDVDTMDNSSRKVQPLAKSAERLRSDKTNRKEISILDKIPLKNDSPSRTRPLKPRSYPHAIYNIPHKPISAKSAEISPVSTVYLEHVSARIKEISDRLRPIVQVASLPSTRISSESSPFSPTRTALPCSSQSTSQSRRVAKTENVPLNSPQPLPVATAQLAVIGNPIFTAKKPAVDMIDGLRGIQSIHSSINGHIDQQTSDAALDPQLAEMLDDPSMHFEDIEVTKTSAGVPGDVTVTNVRGLEQDYNELNGAVEETQSVGEDAEPEFEDDAPKVYEDDNTPHSVVISEVDISHHPGLATPSNSTSLPCSDGECVETSQRHELTESNQTITETQQAAASDKVHADTTENAAQDMVAMSALSIIDNKSSQSILIDTPTECNLPPVAEIPPPERNLLDLLSDPIPTGILPEMRPITPLRKWHPMSEHEPDDLILIEDIPPWKPAVETVEEYPTMLIMDSVSQERKEDSACLVPLSHSPFDSLIELSVLNQPPEAQPTGASTSEDKDKVNNKGDSDTTQDDPANPVSEILDPERQKNLEHILKTNSGQAPLSAPSSPSTAESNSPWTDYTPIIPRISSSLRSVSRKGKKSSMENIFTSTPRQLNSKREVSKGRKSPKEGQYSEDSAYECDGEEETQNSLGEDHLSILDRDTDTEDLSELPKSHPQNSQQMQLTVQHCAEHVESTCTQRSQVSLEDLESIWETEDAEEERATSQHSNYSAHDGRKSDSSSIKELRQQHFHSLSPYYSSSKQAPVTPERSKSRMHHDSDSSPEEDVNSVLSNSSPLFTKQHNCLSIFRENEPPETPSPLSKRDQNQIHHQQLHLTPPPRLPSSRLFASSRSPAASETPFQSLGPRRLFSTPTATSILNGRKTKQGERAIHSSPLLMHVLTPPPVRSQPLVLGRSREKSRQESSFLRRSVTLGQINTSAATGSSSNTVTPENEKLEEYSTPSQLFTRLSTSTLRSRSAIYGSTPGSFRTAPSAAPTPATTREEQEGESEFF